MKSLRRFIEAALFEAEKRDLINVRLVVNGYTVPRNWAVKIRGYRAATAPGAEIRETRLEAMMDEYDYREGGRDAKIRAELEPEPEVKVEAKVEVESSEMTEA